MQQQHISINPWHLIYLFSILYQLSKNRKYLYFNKSLLYSYPDALYLFYIIVIYNESDDD